MTIQTEDAALQVRQHQGPVTIGPARTTRSSWRAATSARSSASGTSTTTPTDDSVNVRLRPEHWRTYDFAKVL